jgi:hypothetical protein
MTKNTKSKNTREDGTIRSILHGVAPQLRKRKLPPTPPDLAAASGTGSFGDFLYRGGPIINTPQVYALFVGDWTSAANQARANRLSQFVVDLMNSRYMNILSQYGCGTTGTLVNRVFVATPDNDLNQAEIEGIVQAAINANSVPEPVNPANNYVLFLDDATGVNRGDIVMCEATSDNAFGFHDFFTTTAGNACAYAVIPGLIDSCLTNSCPSDSSCSLHLGQTQEQRQTQVTSHELAEMWSDPQLNAWTSPTVGENGDICNGQAGTITVGPNTWTVQLMYSKWHDMNTSGGTTCIAETPNPLPSLLPACSVVLDRSTFGKDEVDALLHLSSPATIDAALYVVVDGFTPTQLGVSAISLVGTPNVSPNISLSSTISGIALTPTSLIAEDPATLSGGIQRLTWVYRVSFTDSNGFPTAVGGDTAVTVTASVASTTAPIVSASGSANIHLIHEPNPYEVDGQVSWLSTDVRVFKINAGVSRFAATMGATAADAPTYIQQVLANLNAGATGGDTFDGIDTDEAVSALELSESVGGQNVFNFAIARVRYRALTTDISNVRVFFRLFPVSTTSTNFDPSTAYRRGGQGGVTIPLLGIQGGEISSIPCFAAPRINTATQNMNTQTDPANVRAILHDGSGNEVFAYFGCWLDINQAFHALFPIHPSPVDGPYGSGLMTIQQLVRNAHQCLVAEIAFDPDPVPFGASPGGSDKLAQRNLSIVASDNPGGPASHLIPNTFEVRHTAPVLPPLALPDELIFDWTSVPLGSDATIYIPGISAGVIVEMANELYSSHHLEIVDAHTIKVPARGLTYFPVPPGSGAHLPGMLTVDLPATVRKGELHKVVVRQATHAQGKRIVPPPPIKADTGDDKTARRDPIIRWRQIQGSFQISIPVRTKAVLLAPEERLLAVLRWILLSIPASNRWFPVFTRYVDLIADRVRALGGNPETIQPSPFGDGRRPEPGETSCLTGKVSEVVFGCFGEFVGFVLDSCSSRKAFRSCERGIENLVMRACRDRLTLTVCVDQHQKDRIQKITVRCC